MIRLPQVLFAWGHPGFETALKLAIQNLDSETLPLQAGLTAGSYALDKPLDAMVIQSSETERFIEVKTGIFYKSLMPGCACAGDPTVEDMQNEHITVQVSIDKLTAEATFRLLDE